MKIRTITCHDCYNHGASLQAYALQNYLEHQGHDVQIIHYKPVYLSGHYNIWAIANPAFNKPLIKQLYLFAKLPGRLMSLTRKKVFDDFTANYLHLTRRYNSIKELKADAPDAEVYMAGSDQIWNTKFRNGTDPAFYLDFGRKNVLRLSYAASFATESLADGTEEFVKSKLANFDNISVRESSALNLLRSLGYGGVQVVDPVFLLTDQDWNKIANEDGSNEEYILVYDFMNDAGIRTIAKRLAQKYGCKIFSIGPTRLSYADRNFWKKGPLSFVSLVKRARCVVSNSFHGSAFSIIYQRDFFVVNRKDGLNSRMRDLLTHYQIAERQILPDVQDEILFAPINYKDIQGIIQRDIEASKLWLTTQLRLKK